MAETAPLHVQLIAKTEFVAPSDVPWSTDADGGQALLEFAGRACYQSWSKPNPKTATNAGYLQHIIDVGHFSVLEHASVSFYITGISRSCTHELIRHRHFSYSQLSQRYVPENDRSIWCGLIDTMAMRTLEGEATEVGWQLDKVEDLRPEDYLHLIMHKTCWYATIDPLGSARSSAQAALPTSVRWCGSAFTSAPRSRFVMTC